MPINEAVFGPYVSYINVAGNPVHVPNVIIDPYIFICFTENSNFSITLCKYSGYIFAVPPSIIKNMLIKNIKNFILIIYFNLNYLNIFHH